MKLRELVAEKLGERWSPQQISGWLRREYPDDETMHVSHETIYRSLYIQSRGVLKKELQGQLRRRRKFRQSRATNRGGNRGQIIDAVPISERPPEIEDRAVPGHWEGDLISGSGNTHIATLVERQTRFVLLVQVDGKNTASVVDALIRQMIQLPELVLQTLTWDAVQSLPTTTASAWPPTSMSTSVTRKARGSAARTRTPTDCYASTFRRARTSATTRRIS